MVVEPLEGRMLLTSSEGVGGGVSSVGIVNGGVGTSTNGLSTNLGQGAGNDFNHDGVSDPAIYIPNLRPDLAAFSYRPSGGGTDVIQAFGVPGTGQSLPAPGAYSGLNQTELAVYLPSTGSFVVRPFFGAPDVTTQFGIPGPGNSIPAPGDYDGSARTELAVYLPTLGAFAYRPASGANDRVIPFGPSGYGQSIPVPGDYFGTGVTDLAVYMPNYSKTQGAFAIRNPISGTDEIIPFGKAGAGNTIPMPGDYDGAGRTELAVYIPSLAEFIYQPANGGPLVTESFGIAGAGQTLPAAGDYDGAGHTELAAYLPSQGVFAYRPANGGPDVIQPFGIAGLGKTVPFNEVTANTLALASAPTKSVSSSTTASSASTPIPIPSDVINPPKNHPVRKRSTVPLYRIG